MKNLENVENTYFAIVTFKNVLGESKDILLYNDSVSTIKVKKNYEEFDSDDRPHMRCKNLLIDVVDRDKWKEFFTDIPVTRHCYKSYNIYKATYEDFDEYHFLGECVATDYNPLPENLEDLYIDRIARNNCKLPICGSSGPDKKVIEYLNSFTPRKAEKFEKSLFKDQEMKKKLNDWYAARKAKLESKEEKKKKKLTPSEEPKNLVNEFESLTRKLTKK